MKKEVFLFELKVSKYSLFLVCSNVAQSLKLYQGLKVIGVNYDSIFYESRLRFGEKWPYLVSISNSYEKFYLNILSLFLFVGSFLSLRELNIDSFFLLFVFSVNLLVISSFFFFYPL